MGIKVSCKIKSKNNYKLINNIIKELPKTAEKGILEAVKGTCQYALQLAKRQNGITFEIVETSNKKVVGRVYTEQDIFAHSWFVEYGTGIYAEQPHIGTSKTFLESGYQYWFVPVDKVKKTLGYPIIEMYGVQFYIARSVEARPYMRPAEFQRRNDNVDAVQEEIYQMLRRVCE